MGVVCDVVNITVQCLALAGQCPHHSEASGDREDGGEGGAPGGGGTSCLDIGIISCYHHE